MILSTEAELLPKDCPQVVLWDDCWDDVHEKLTTWDWKRSKEISQRVTHAREVGAIGTDEL